MEQKAVAIKIRDQRPSLKPRFTKLLVSDNYPAFQQTYRRDFTSFARNCVTWKEHEGLTTYQEECGQSLMEHRRVSVRGPHGLGKTTFAALTTLWFFLTRDGQDWKVVTTASVWRQLQKYLWPEIHKWSRRLRWDVIGRRSIAETGELLDLSIKGRTGEAFAVASDTPALIEGAHAEHMLYIFDESKTIPDATFDAAEGALSGAGGDTKAEAYALAISTPGEPQGRFYAIQARKPGFEDWHVRHVTRDEVIQAGRMSVDWAEQRKRQWGEESQIYQNRVLGEFATSAEDGVIPLAWIEAAQERWRLWDSAGRPGVFHHLGNDVARYGQDKTTIALVLTDTGIPEVKRVVSEIRVYAKQDTMVTAGRVAGILKKHGGTAVVDVDGLGAGVVDKLREEDCEVIAFSAGSRSEQTDRSGELGFVNQRSAAWWGLRELLDPANHEYVALPPDEAIYYEHEQERGSMSLVGDLTAPHWQIMSGGKISVEQKDKIRERIGRSTDLGDAVMMALSHTTMLEPRVHRF